ncbi:hypothetical protein [Desulfosporosinus youngiae]|uniref:Uncharacterized protein n=1 Tax=Desulfosporosinus youngiae DSM 17734 TaxID=768710 RepID=H5XWE0_9FIRM|nr:hypothetical protein [Desulfosporosinus youngiae]EHQ90309.1 hypothetical protein DesyoDRAFT_3279 [Desulfosporosinus youngiae DSM 17734]
MFDENETIEPMDTCGCGDIGYLTARTVPIDLAHGVGRIDKVPVYHCRSAYCQEFSLPPVVSRRLETIAEQMEETQATETTYTWQDKEIPVQDSGTQPDQTALDQTTDELALQAFTLQFVNRQYEDARVVQIVPGQAILFRSKLEDSEYYLLRYEEDSRTEGIWFSFLKFYYDEPNLTYEDFLEWSEDGHLKELGRIILDEVEDTLIDEFGEWT